MLCATELHFKTATTHSTGSGQADEDVKISIEIPKEWGDYLK